MTAEQAESRINNRCLDNDYPSVSDILGSDWGAEYSTGYLTPNEYRELAVRHAYRVLPTMWKNGIPLKP